MTLKQFCRFPIWAMAFLLTILSCKQTKREETPTVSGSTVFSADFHRPKNNQVWKLTTTKDSIVIDTITDFKNGHVQFDSGNVLKSPKFDMEALTYYRLGFKAKTSGPCMWAMVFFDSDGNLLPADIYSSINPSKNIVGHRFYFQSKFGAVQAQFWLQPNTTDAEVGLEAVSIAPVMDFKAIRTWADSVYATIPPMDVVSVPHENRERFIPKTMNTLKSGKKWRIVMLGNSIINDTGNSAWEVLLKEKWPKADLEVITSVAGGKGCWYYQEENRVDDFVVRYNPDLLIIGGISQRKDTAAIHTVIDQVRKKISPEILLFTGPVGRGGDPRSNPDFIIPAPDDDYRSMLKKIAEEVNVGYWDMQTEWGKYIRGSDRPYELYLRDPVHANANGRQILARLMTAYFSPDSP